MFFPGSRYQDLGTYTVTRGDGSTVTATRLPLPSSQRLRGFHVRRDGERLDLLAAHYLADATAFWRLCDASGTVAPDALATRAQIAIPTPRR